MPKQTRSEKLAEKRINRIYMATCSGVSIPMLEIGNIFKKGHEAIQAGADDAGIAEAISAYVHTIAI